MSLERVVQDTASVGSAPSSWSAAPASSAASASVRGALAILLECWADAEFLSAQAVPGYQQQRGGGPSYPAAQLVGVARAHGGFMQQYRAE